MAIYHIICSSYYLAHAHMYDVACEFVCAEGWDAQKQLARTSLSIDLEDNNGEPSVIEWQILRICKTCDVPTSGYCCS